MATEVTVASGAFVRELIKLDPDIKVFQNACALLVPIVEAGEYNSKAAEIILKEYLEPLIRENIDTLILGCTHYGVLEQKIRKIIGSGVHIISGAKVVPHKLEEYFQKHMEIENKIGKGGLERIYTTDLTEGFETQVSIFLGKHVNVQKITLA